MCLPSGYLYGRSAGCFLRGEIKKSKAYHESGYCFTKAITQHLNLLLVWSIYEFGCGCHGTQSLI